MTYESLMQRTKEQIDLANQLVDLLSQVQAVAGELHRSVAGEDSIDGLLADASPASMRQEAGERY